MKDEIINYAEAAVIAALGWLSLNHAVLLISIVYGLLNTYLVFLKIKEARLNRKQNGNS